MELAKKVNAIVLDKTGTITEGRPQVTGIKWLNNEDTAKEILLSIEKQSEHPLAEAVVKHLGDVAASARAETTAPRSAPARVVTMRAGVAAKKARRVSTRSDRGGRALVRPRTHPMAMTTAKTASPLVILSMISTRSQHRLSPASARRAHEAGSRSAQAPT